MTLSLRTASTAAEPTLSGFIDAAFQRRETESRLTQEVTSSHPDFDPGLSLVAELDGEDAGFALFLPRRLRVRECWVPMAIVGPYATLPRFRERGVAHYLMETGMGALKDRGLRGAVTLGDPAFLEHFGFASAFNVHHTSVPVELLPRDSGAAEWGPLVSEHLTELCEIHDENYAAVGGAEKRLPATVEWACLAPETHTLVLEAYGKVEAYVRLRIRERIEIPECGARSEAGVEALLCFFRRLASEHERPLVDVGLPPSHPVARALFHAGCPQSSNNLSGGAMLAVLDWPGILNDTAPSWRRALDQSGQRGVSFQIGEQCLRIARRGRGIKLEARRDKRWHLELPREWWPALLTGQRHYHDLAALDGLAPELKTEQGRALLCALFPVAESQWGYSPAYEIAAE